MEEPLTIGEKRSDIRKVIKELEIKYDREFRQILMSPRMRILLNGRDVFSMAGLDTRLSEGDELTFMHVLGGG